MTPGSTYVSTPSVKICNRISENHLGSISGVRCESETHKITSGGNNFRFREKTVPSVSKQHRNHRTNFWSDGKKVSLGVRGKGRHLRRGDKIFTNSVNEGFSTTSNTTKNVT